MAWSIVEAIEYYHKMGAPNDQSALISLLKEVQAECGGSVPVYAVGVITERYGIRESLILAIIRRIPSLRLGDRHLLELCAGPNCGKHLELAEYAEKCMAEGGNFELKYVPCMRLCGKGPNLKWDGKLHHKADPALLDQLLGK